MNEVVLALTTQTPQVVLYGNVSGVRVMSS